MKKSWSSRWLLCTAVLAAVLALVSAEEVKYDHRTCRGTSLHPKSTWPSDHGDCSRSKFTIGAGLPSNVTSADIKRIDNVVVGNAQWIYTGGENAEFVFALGPNTGVYVAKFDALTLELLQKVDLGSCLYLGGAVVHSNGHLYVVHTNRLYRFWNLDLYNVTTFDIPTPFDPYLTQTNGMLLTHDGQLVIKQWPLYWRDFDLLNHGKPELFRALLVIIVTICLIRMSKTPKTERTVFGLTRRLIKSLFWGFVLDLMLFTALLSFLAHGPIDVIRFYTNNYLQGEVGELKIIDPDMMSVTTTVTLPERCSFARMALSTSVEGKEDSLVLLGDEFVHQLRWNSHRRELSYLPTWTKRYRTHGDGTFPGTGPTIFNDVAYFTDNTFAVSLSGHSYSMFSQPLNEFEKPLSSVHLTKPGSPPGFMFWSITVSPIVGDVIAWDIAGRSVQSRRATDLSLHWEILSMNADCLTLAADKKHVYLSDHNKNPGNNTNLFMSWIKKVQDVTKHFVIASTETGEILANVTISREDGVKPSIFVPGANNDVIIGTSVGISRLYA